jgi:hypothetical protein
MPNHTDSLEQIDNKLQQSSHVLDDTTYIFGKPRYDKYNDYYEVEFSK